jgi:hypothetical protein
MEDDDRHTAPGRDFAPPAVAESYCGCNAISMRQRTITGDAHRFWGRRRRLRGASRRVKAACAECPGRKPGRRAAPSGSFVRCRGVMVGVYGPRTVGDVTRLAVLRPRPFVATARLHMMPSCDRPDGEPASIVENIKKMGRRVVAPQARCGASSPLPPHRTCLTWLGRHRAGARQSNDTQQLTFLCPKALSSGERITLGPVHNQKPRGSHRLSCASATCNSLCRQATGPQQRKGGSSPNPRSCARLTQVFCDLQARKALEASLSCA